MFPNRMTLVAYTGQKAKTFATPACKEITRLSVPTPTLSTGLGMEGQDAMGRFASCTAALLSTQPISRREAMSLKETELPRIHAHYLLHRADIESHFC